MSKRSHTNNVYPNNLTRNKKKQKEDDKIKLFNYEVQYDFSSNEMKGNILLFLDGYIKTRQSNPKYKMKKLNLNSNNINNNNKIETIQNNKISAKNDRKKVFFSKDIIKIKRNNNYQIPILIQNLNGNILDKIYIQPLIESLYTNVYLNFLTGNNIKKSKFTNKYRENILDNFNLLLNLNEVKMNQYHIYNSNNTWVETNASKFIIQRDKLLNINNNVTIRKNLDILRNPAYSKHDYIFNIETNKKVILIGDLHGSFHSFFRLFLRFLKKGYIKNDLTLDENIKIVFLGDVIDRGNYSIEILVIIFILMYKNNTKDELNVILNKGNHEDFNIFHRDGFSNEIKSKYENKTNNPYLVSEMIFDFCYFTSLLSSGIILTRNSKRYWLCHGGFKIETKHNNCGLINRRTGELYERYYEFSKNDKGNYIKNATRKNRPKVKQRHLMEPVILENHKILDFNNPRKYTSDILWSDFSSINFDVYKNIHRSDVSGKMFIIGANLLDNFLKKNNIDFIIRGHQDSYCNNWILTKFHNTYSKKLGRPLIDNDLRTRFLLPLSFIISSSIIKYKGKNNKIKFNSFNNKETDYYSMKNVEDTINHKGKEINNTKEKISKTNGPICTIYPSEFKDWYNNYDEKDFEILPLLTISNNSDKGRYLYNDSYALIE